MTRFDYRAKGQLSDSVARAALFRVRSASEAVVDGIFRLEADPSGAFQPDARAALELRCKFSWRRKFDCHDEQFLGERTEYLRGEVLNNFCLKTQLCIPSGAF